LEPFSAARRNRAPAAPIPSRWRSILYERRLEIALAASEIQTGGTLDDNGLSMTVPSRPALAKRSKSRKIARKPLLFRHVSG